MEMLQNDSCETSIDLVINGVFSNAIGHAVEAIMIANGYRNALPLASITVLLHSGVPRELSDCVQHMNIRLVFVDTADFISDSSRRQLFECISRECDYLYTLRDEKHVAWDDVGLKRFHVEFREWIHARHRMDILGGTATSFPLLRPSPIRLKPPEPTRRKFAKFFTTEQTPRILILPGSATFQKYITGGFAIELIRSLKARYSNAVFVLMGSFNGDQSATRGLSSSMIEEIVNSDPGIKNAFDLGFANQLAIAEQCDLLISPHSGMSFAIQAVGVPWLALSSWMNHEYLTNGVPLVSIVPKCERYPCTSQTPEHQMLDECKVILQQGRSPLACSSDAALLPRIPEIVAKADILISKSVGYRQLMRDHRRRLKQLSSSAMVFENAEYSRGLLRYRGRIHNNILAYHRYLEQVGKGSTAS